MSEYKENLLKAKKVLGSFERVGEICGVSGKAVMKWAANGRPPRTEYSGETDYAEKISRAVGGDFTKSMLLPTVQSQIRQDEELIQLSQIRMPLRHPGRRRSDDRRGVNNQGC